MGLMFQTIQYFKKSIGLNNPCGLLEKLFDTLVVPVILYGSEIWGLETSLNDSEPFEYMHMKFIKEILGVHYKATNAACRAELGRLPLKSKVQTAAINFWEHIITSQNSLVSSNGGHSGPKSFKPEKNLEFFRLKSWVQR